jgi:hypothetical protein
MPMDVMIFYHDKYSIIFKETVSRDFSSGFLIKQLRLAQLACLERIFSQILVK